MNNNDIRIIYIADIRFPMERANAIQSIHTCHALAEKGADVNFIVRKMDKKPDENSLAFFGLKPHENLKLKRVRVVNSHGSYLLWKISFLISSFCTIVRLSFTRKKLVYFTRDLRIAQLYSLIAKFFGAKVIFEAHTISHKHFAEIHTLYTSAKHLHERKIEKKRKLEKKVYSRMDGIIVITDHLKTQMEADFAPKCKIAVVRDAAKSPAKFPEFKDEKGICYIGQLYPWKGVDLLVDSMRNIEKEKLYIIGGLEFENDLKNLRKKVREYNIEDRVIFVGTVPHKEVKRYMEQAKVCVIPLPFSQIAAYFTSPMKMFEYLAAGKAIVASELPSLCEVLEDGKNAVLFKPGDEKSLTEQLHKVLEDEKLRRNLKRNAWETSKDHTWAKRAESILGLIKSALI
ncbi:MAG: glycosyltransferase family 4 protein [Acidobacteria bacterium]|nr:glycosyltransferase family 4 protein [Acidobacteriota bacterium]